jgi:hypothetical protein
MDSIVMWWKGVIFTLSKKVASKCQDDESLGRPAHVLWLKFKNEIGSNF